MLRIDLISTDPSEVVVRLAGAIADQEVGLLAEASQTWMRSGRRVVLEVSEVDFIDQAGLVLLRAWSDQGVVLRGPSLYVRFLLQSQGLVPEPGAEQA
jgi:anti-anti-sigma regulatory factor